MKDPFSINPGMPVVAPKTGGNSCELCGAFFRYLPSLQKHMEQHAEQTRINKCDVCGEVCENVLQLKMHLETHENYQPYTCQICNESVCQKRLLSRHVMEKHTEGNQCKVCERSFDEPRFLTRHMSAHNPQKYTCGECNAVIIGHSYFKRHQILHTGLKSFICQLCGRSFAEKRGLRKHMQSIHDAVT